MKITLDKKDRLQVGDVLHFDDGDKLEVLLGASWCGRTTEEVSAVYEMHDYPFRVVKATRKVKRTKERELGPDEVLQVGDVVYSPSGKTTEVEHLAGYLVCHLDTTQVSKVARNTPRVTRREWKRRALEAEARIKKVLKYIDTLNARTSNSPSVLYATPSSAEIRKILRGEE